jgi:hypothetical protein
MFRRIKLLLNDLPELPPHVEAVEARLDLADALGGPVCGTIHPPSVQWRVC